MSQLPEGSYKPLNSAPESILGWEVPVEAVPLPSGGKLYPPDSFFHNKEMIEIKAMTAKEEDILTSRAYSKLGTTIDHLIASCAMCSVEDVKGLLLGDRNALLVAIRVTGYGADYQTEVTCPACSKKSEHSFDLGSLEIKTLSVQPVKDGSRIFEFLLPVSKKKVHFKLVNSTEDEAIDKDMETSSKMLGVNSVGRVTHSLFNKIVSIDGVVDRDQIRRFVDIMPAFDSKSLRKYMNEIEPKIDMETHLTCKHCGQISKLILPIGRNFFWPS